MELVTRPDAPERARRILRDEVVWHDLECGSYRADLPLWRELAERNPGPILEIGAGTGRVALALARAGHDVTALERDGALAGALRERVAGAGVAVIEGDARSLELQRRDFALCIVAMQTIQLLGGAGARSTFLRRARSHLRHGGLLACAILGPIQAFDCAAGEPGPEPEVAHADGLLCVSTPTRVHVGRRVVVIERERHVSATARGVPRSGQGPRGVLARQRSAIELYRVSERGLRREAAAAGLQPEASLTVAATEDHVGSTVVVLRA
jgi:SAM-dependent methyltransferase